MAMCPECRAEYGDDVQTCPAHGCELVPSDLFLRADVPLAAGTMVGEYRIQHKLGAGTFGDVYAGEHPLIGKRVAVKVLNQRFASDPVIVSRFVAEARAVNKIRQRNIIDIFSFGVLPELQRHYFVMELLDGVTLGALMDATGRLAIPVVLQIVRGIADGLDAVHEAGITHRDLKPDNVFLATERDGTYFPKLLDFGIAKLLGEDVAHKTGSGMVLGTPRYMSPEQARGKPADHRADVYALGVMIHEMLTGTPLFVGESSVDVLLMHAADPPPRMSSACPDLAPALDAPVLAMLEKNPKDRPSSAGAAVAALVACARRLGLDDAAAERAGSAAARVGGVEGNATLLDGRRLAATPRRSTPSGEAPAELEIASTLASDPAGDGASPAGRSGHVTEGLPAIETSSGITGLGGSLRWKVALGSLAAIAVGFSIWALGRPARPSDGGLATDSGALAAPTIVATSALLPLPVATSSGPTVNPAAAPDVVELRLVTRPAEVEVWLADRKLGTSAAPVTLPRGSERVEVRLKKLGFKDETLALTPDRSQSIEASLTPAAGRREPSAPVKPASSAGRMDRILGDRD